MNNDILETIAPTDLRDFLKSKGWVLVDEAVKDGLYVLNNPQYSRRQLAFPIDNSTPDYLDCVATIIQKLVDLESCSFREWMMAFSEMKDDAIGYRIVDQRNESAYIPLNYAIEALKGAKDILLSAAHSVLKPKAYHPKLKRKEAAQLLENSRFRHTESGSFVIKVSTPVKAMDLQADVFGNTPFVRQATLVINQSISQLVEAIESDKMEQLIKVVRDDSSPILSSNICKALLNFNNINNNADLFLNFKWASIINKPPKTRDSIKIQSDYYSRIEEIGKELKNQEKDKEGTFIGTVEVLAGDLDASEQRTGDVILDLYVQDGESIRARVNLKAEWHSLAIKAYENAGHYIQIRGTLQSGNQPRVIKDVKSFSIIAESER